MAGNWQKKDCATILSGYSSGEDSDAGDSLNVRSVQKNASRVSELLHAAIPGLDPSQSRTPPMGMNNINVIREGLVDAIVAQSLGSRGSPATSHLDFVLERITIRFKNCLCSEGKGNSLEEIDTPIVIYVGVTT